MKKITFLLFLISCSAFAQFSENFDGGSSIPAGWAVVNGGDPNTWNFTAPGVGTAHSGTNVAKILYSAAAAHDDYLITPQINVAAGVNDRMTFWVKTRSANYIEHFDIKLSVAGTNAADFTITLMSDTAAPTEWTQMPIDLSPYAGQSVYVGFHAVSLDMYELYFDDIVNDAQPVTVPSCDAALISPANGAVNASASGMLTWSAATGGVGYRLSVGTTPNGTDVLNMFDAGQTLSYDIPGTLNPNTQYYVKIIPYNTYGSATGCTEYSFTTMNVIPGDFCSNAINLGALTSPYTGTTLGASDDSNPSCQANTASDLYFSIVVPNGYTITIGQTENEYDSKNYVFYGDCNNKSQISCFDDNDIQNVVWKNTTGSSKTLYWVQDGYQSDSGSFTLAWHVVACTSATASYTVVSDCANGDQFKVNVNVTNMGSAASLSINDDQGSNPLSLTAPGTVQFGPYPNNTPVIFTVANDQDPDCILTSEPQTQSMCPPNCASAIPIAACGTGITANIAAGTGAWNMTGCALQTTGRELMYSFTPTQTGLYSLEIDAASGGYVDYFYKAAGSCDTNGWACIGDFNGSAVFPIGMLTAGTQYWLLLDGEGVTEKTSLFKIACAPSCTNGTATYTIVSDCANGAQFKIDVAVTNMGTASSYTIKDDQGSTPLSLSGTGTVQFGPYPNGIGVVITLTNDQDSSCVLTSPLQTQAICPPDCATATPIAHCGDLVTALLVAGNGAWNSDSCGFDTPGTEKLYSFTPTETGMYSLEITSASDGYIDYSYKAASGSCDANNWICIDDNNEEGTDPIGILTAGTAYWILLDSEETDVISATFRITCPPSCTNGTATYTVVSDCQNGPQFKVAVAITNMGTAASYTISDDQGSNTQSLSAIGSVTFGPYPNGSPVIFTVANDQDANCFMISSPKNQTQCPPVNDNFANALPVSCGQVYSGNTSLATLDEDNAPDFGSADMDAQNVWYSYTGTGSPQTVTLDLCGSNYDTSVLVYTGTSGNLTAVAGNDDAGDSTCPESGSRSYLSFNSDGTSTYFIAIEGWNFGTTGAYTMNVSCAQVEPPAVENQTCALALPIPVNGTVIQSDNSHGTVNNVQPECDDFDSIQDVWFSFVAPDLGVVEITVARSTMASLNFSIYSGTCNNLILVPGTCNANIEQTTSASELLAGLIPGNTYYIQVWSNFAEQGTFSVKALDQNLGISDPEPEGFSYFPNPVGNVLNLSYTQDITNVAVYSLSGQLVIAKNINARRASIDMGHLAAGTYFVKVTANGMVKTLKILKG